jgi:tetratricopeptide (TPR) repeat protein
MHFDPTNKIVQLCANGIEMETTQPEEAKALFLQAWNASTNDFEKCIAAHYVARHQISTEDKLQWDKTALDFALKIDDGDIQPHLPSLYLNVAKCYEDLKDYDNAIINYQNALSYENHLPEDGYGQMIRAGISNGIKRVR